MSTCAAGRKIETHTHTRTQMKRNRYPDLDILLLSLGLGCTLILNKLTYCCLRIKMERNPRKSCMGDFIPILENESGKYPGSTGSSTLPRI
jgi:hypothetical protein